MASEAKVPRTSVLLATAAVNIYNENGHFITVRALLDSASQSSFITESCPKCLGLARKKCGITV